MPKYQFLQDITVQGVNRTAGQVVEAVEIPAGSLSPLLRGQFVQEVDHVISETVPESVESVDVEANQVTRSVSEGEPKPQNPTSKKRK